MRPFEGHMQGTSMTISPHPIKGIWNEELQHVTWRESRPLGALQDPWPLATDLWAALLQIRREYTKRRLQDKEEESIVESCEKPTTCEEIAVGSRSATGGPRAWAYPVGEGSTPVCYHCAQPGRENFESMPSCQKRTSQTERSHARPQPSSKDQNLGGGSASGVEERAQPKWSTRQAQKGETQRASNGIRYHQ